jgi:class 3 adenylate cyclase
MIAGTERPAGRVDLATDGGSEVPVDDELLERLLERRRLRFPEPLESAFHGDFARRWLRTNRSAFWIGIVLYLALAALDVYAAPDSAGQLLLIRIGFLAVYAIPVMLLSRRPWYLRWMQPVSAIGVFLGGLAIVMMELALEPHEPAYGLYIFGATLVISFGYAVPRLRLPWAAAAGWSIAVASLAVAIDHASDDPTAVARFVTIEAFIVVTNVLGMIGAYFIELGDRRNFLQELRVDRERERSRALMLNILPEVAADRLLRGEEVADRYDDVTVLFADIVDFTPMSSGMSPHETAAILNEVFSAFDRLTERHGLEKIKTIGDAYMVVGGLPERSHDHPERVAAMALEMQDSAEELTRRLGRPIALRIGIHTGPVVAGVIGLRKFSYDLWGDTVNTASRMESHAARGSIQVTDAVFRRLHGRFLFDGPGTIDVKGKGPMRTYTLRGMAAAPAPTPRPRRSRD